MNKRQKKKMEKKTLPLLADEYPLLTMTTSELEVALDQAEKYRKKYGYRKKYSSLKKEKFLHYTYSIGQNYLEMHNEIFEMATARK